MANFGWAYINCSDTGSAGTGTAVAKGPSGSIQFMAGETSGSTTGSMHLLFYTASVYGHHENHLILSGNMTITGTLSASAIHYTDVTRIDATGSTFFGNDNADRHIRTGSFAVIRDDGTSILSASAYTKQVYVKGFCGGYRSVTSSHYTASAEDYILGIATPFTGGTSPVRVTIPIPSLTQKGRILVIKDEATARGGSSIVITRSAGPEIRQYTFDGDSLYTLTGTMPAISLYSNGVHWFVF